MLMAPRVPAGGARAGWAGIAQRGVAQECTSIPRARGPPGRFSSRSAGARRVAEARTGARPGRRGRGGGNIALLPDYPPNGGDLSRRVRSPHSSSNILTDQRTRRSIGPSPPFAGGVPVPMLASISTPASGAADRNRSAALRASPFSLAFFAPHSIIRMLYVYQPPQQGTSGCRRN